MNYTPFITILNKVLFDKKKVSFAKENEILLTPSFIESLKEIRSNKVSQYLLQQIKETINEMNTIDKSSILQITITNEELFHAMFTKSMLGIYPDCPNINDFDFQRDASSLLLTKNIPTVFIYFIYEHMLFPIYKVQDFKKTITKKDYFDLCSLISKHYFTH
ncbi:MULTISPECIES: hypothetical protein [unclassified Myroides]|uniref:hypothetical protein n=1 Tax=unclassified Myroides TaxID=2642485 RepID=UPI0031014B69